MKTIIAGSRTCTDSSIVHEAADSCLWLIEEVVSGTCVGPDRFGEDWAFKNEVPIKRFPANWPKFGSGAGYIRNAEMANYADALIAIWDGFSKGTANMIDLARSKNLKVKVVLF